jgi:hypothetical protein
MLLKASIIPDNADAGDDTGTTDSGGNGTGTDSPNSRTSNNTKTRSLSERLENLVRCAIVARGYSDISFSGSVAPTPLPWLTVAVTGGAMLSRSGTNFYIGGGGSTPGVSVTFQKPLFYSEPSPGINLALQGGLGLGVGGSGQLGTGPVTASGLGSPYIELGGGAMTSAGVGASAFWVAGAAGQPTSCE